MLETEPRPVLAREHTAVSRGFSPVPQVDHSKALSNRSRIFAAKETADALSRRLENFAESGLEEDLKTAVKIIREYAADDHGRVLVAKALHMTQKEIHIARLLLEFREKDKRIYADMINMFAIIDAFAPRGKARKAKVRLGDKVEKLLSGIRVAYAYSPEDEIEVKKFVLKAMMFANKDGRVRSFRGVVGDHYGDSESKEIRIGSVSLEIESGQLVIVAARPQTRNDSEYDVYNIVSDMDDYVIREIVENFTRSGFMALTTAYRGSYFVSFVDCAAQWHEFEYDRYGILQNHTVSGKEHSSPPISCLNLELEYMPADHGGFEDAGPPEDDVSDGGAADTEEKNMIDEPARERFESKLNFLDDFDDFMEESVCPASNNN